MIKQAFAVICAVGLSAAVYAAPPSTELNQGHIHHLPTNGKANVDFHAAPGGSGQLVDHGGEVMTNAKVVYIFWGWASTTTDSYVREVISFRDDVNGMQKHIGMLSQYHRRSAAQHEGDGHDGHGQSGRGMRAAGRRLQDGHDL
jgi:hypothetical protein